VPHAFTVKLRSEKSTQAPVTAPSQVHTAPDAAQRRADTHTFPFPQSALELQLVEGAPGTVHASPVTHTFEQASPEQHAPLGQARHTFSAAHMPQRTFVVSQDATGVVVDEGHALESPWQQG
jgi:hypothetical protein